LSKKKKAKLIQKQKKKKGAPPSRNSSQRTSLTYILFNLHLPAYPIHMFRE